MCQMCPFLCFSLSLRLLRQSVELEIKRERVPPSSPAFSNTVSLMFFDERYLLSLLEDLTLELWVVPEYIAE